MADRGSPNHHLEESPGNTYTFSPGHTGHHIPSHVSSIPDTPPLNPPRSAKITGITDNFILEDAVDADTPSASGHRPSLPPIMENSDTEHPIETETSPKPERHLSKSYETSARKRSNAIDPTVLLDNLRTSLADPPVEEPSRDAVPLDILTAPDDNEERYNPKVSFHRFSLEMTHSKSFNRFMLFIIMVNAIAIALEMEIPEDDENSRVRNL